MTNFDALTSDLALNNQAEMPPDSKSSIKDAQRDIEAKGSSEIICDKSQVLNQNTVDSEKDKMLRSSDLFDHTIEDTGKESSEKIMTKSKKQKAKSYVDGNMQNEIKCNCGLTHTNIKSYCELLLSDRKSQLMGYEGKEEVSMPRFECDIEYDRPQKKLIVSTENREAIASNGFSLQDFKKLEQRLDFL